MKKITLLIAGVLFIALLGYIYWHFILSNSGERSQMGAVPVSVIKVQAKTITLHEELPGRIVASQVAEIRPQVSGIITNRLFHEGSEVEKGQQLYQIDPAPYQEAYRSMQANLEKARAHLEYFDVQLTRYKKLIKSNAVSKQEYDDTKANLSKAKADVSIAKAAVSKAKINLDYTKVYSPISGYIGKSSVTTGALVTASQQTALAKVTQLDPIYLDMVQSSSKLLHMRNRIENDKDVLVDLLLDDGKTHYPYKGKLQFFDVTVEPTTSSVLLRALVPNPDEMLLPGMFVRAKVKLKDQNFLLVPQRSTSRTSDNDISVWVLDDKNKVMQKSITVERALGDTWLVSEGVSADDTIVLEGGQKLYPGATVIPAFVDDVSVSQK